MKLSFPAWMILAFLCIALGCGVKRPPSPLYATPNLQGTPTPTPEPGEETGP